MNGYNFTDRVRKVLQMAREEAARLRHEFVGTEHILLGIVQEGAGVSAAVLTNLNADLEAIRRRIEDKVKTGRGGAAAGQDLPYTSRAKKVLELAMAEARELDHAYVGTEHLLLGLLREEKGVAAQVLTEAGITLEQARAETIRLLGQEFPRRVRVPGSRASRPGSGTLLPLTDRARKALGLAAREAARLGRDHVGPEHLLLGIIVEGEAVPTALLHRAKVDAETLRKDVERMAGRGDADLGEASELPLTLSATNVLDLAAVEAHRLFVTRIATEHVLLGLLREEKEIAAQALSAAGLTLQAARTEVAKLGGSG